MMEVIQLVPSHEIDRSLSVALSYHLYHEHNNLQAALSQLLATQVFKQKIAAL